MRLRLLAALCFVLTLPLLFSCSKDSPTESKPTVPTLLTLTPTTGPPMTTVALSGIDPSKVNLEECYIVYDDIPSGLLVDTAGVVTSTVPVILNSDSSWTASGNQLSVAIVNSITEDTIAFGADLFTVTDLPPAPGTTAEMFSDLSRIHQALGSLFEALYPTPNVELGITSGFLGALDSIVNGVDSLSLPFMLADMQNNSSDGLALYDAILASGGMAEQTSAFADIISAIADSGIALAKRHAIENSATTTLTDEDLAWKMQFYVVLKQFGNTVIKPTAGTYSKIHGFIGIGAKIPLSTVVSAALSLTDFIVNKFVVAMLPAHIDDMTLEFDSDTIIMGNQTDNTITIYASNDPPAITLLDMTKLTLTLLGLNGAGKSANITQREFDEFYQFLERIALYVLKLIRSELAAFNSRNPEVALDVNLGQVPHLDWKAEITDKKFVELKTFTQTIIEGDAGEPRWVSLGPDWGEGRVYAATTVDPAAIVIPQPPGFAYSGGAFGEDVEKTETKSVWVKPNLVMKMTMPNRVEEVNFEPMIIQAGYEVPVAPQPYRRTGPGAVDTVWSPNVQLNLQVVGGNAQSASGVTNANGEFVTGLALNSGSNRISVTTTGHGDVGTVAQVKETICAGSASTGPFGLTLGLPGARKSVPGLTNELRVFTTYAGCVDIQLVAVNGTVSPTSFSTDADGHAFADLILPMDTDSMIVYATALGTTGYMEYDTIIVHSYCLPDQACSFGGSGLGTYTETGTSCQSATITASASVGAASRDDFRIEDPISIIAADSNLWNENCIVWFDVSYSWSISGGSQTGNGIEASLSSPGQNGFTFAAAGSGTDASNSGTAVVPVRGIPLAPWGYDSILGRFQVTAIPNPDVPNNTAISNSLSVQITGISKVTLMDGVTNVNILCAQTGSGLSYSSP